MIRSFLLLMFLSLCLTFSEGLADETKSNSLREKFTIGLNYNYISFKMNENFDFPSGTYDINGSVTFNNNWSIMFIIPYSTYSHNGESVNALGNITAGIKYDSDEDEPFHFKGLLSLPTISNSDMFASLISVADFWNMPRHLWGGIIADLEVEQRYLISKDFFANLGLGTFLMFPTAEDNKGDVEDYLKYFVKGGYEKMNSIGCDASIKGVFLLTADGDFENKFVHMVNIGVSYKTETFNPRFYFVLPIGENYSEIIKHLFGLELKVNIK